MPLSDHNPLGNAATPSVLLIMSASRSGSTILCNILGQTAGAFGVGELHRLWDSAAIDSRMCSCGERVIDCPVWSSILRVCYGASDTDTLRAAIAEIERHRDACARVRHMLPSSDLLSPTLAGHRQAYRRALETIYTAIQSVTGCRLIVDASKLPAYAHVLLGCPSIDARILWLIRDPRATAFSWRRRKTTVVRGRAFTTAQYSLTASAKEWLVTNWAAERVARAVPEQRLLRLRYEDLMREPEAALRRVVQWAGLPADGLPLTGPRQVRLATAHLIAGNQNRFQAGDILLRPDEEWRAAMGQIDRKWVSLLTWPLLRRFGYA